MLRSCFIPYISKHNFGHNFNKVLNGVIKKTTQEECVSDGGPQNKRTC